MRQKDLTISIVDDAFFQEAFLENDSNFEEYVNRVINSRLYEMKIIRRDMDLFRKYLNEHKRNNQLLWLYSYKLRKAHGWTHSYLLDIEDNILGSRIKDED